MDRHSISLPSSIWDVAALSAQTLDSMLMLLSAYEVHALYDMDCVTHNYK